MHWILLPSALGLAVAGSPAGVNEVPEDARRPLAHEELLDLEGRVKALERSQGAAGGGDSKPATNEIKGVFKDGFKFETQDKRFKAQFGGRLHFDLGGVGTDDDFEAGVGHEEDGARFRRARFFMSGEIHELVEYKWQYDFAGGTDNKFKDVYMGLKESPVGGVRVGQFKEPFSLEEVTSSNFTTFMERAPVNALVPQRNVGIMVHDHNASKTMTWAVGAFRDDGSDTGTNDGDGETNVTARVTGTPWYRDEGEDLLHLGLAVSRRQGNEDMLAYASKGASGLTANNAVNTGAFGAEEADLIGAEAAWVAGPLSLQGEFVQSSVDAIAGSDPDFSGWYAFVSYFLTGEHRVYKNTSAAFDRVQPARDYGTNGGGGAWELALRHGNLDLTDGSIDGGELTDTSLGLTWYLNPFTKVMFNYVREEVEPIGGGDEGTADILQMRFAFEF